MDTIKLSDHFTFGRLLRFAAPSMGMFIFMSIYGVVDGLFVSNYAGKTAFAAVNFIWPFLMLLSTPGFMLGTGGSALVAKTLGERDSEKANRLFSLFCYVAAAAGAVFMVAAFAVMPFVAAKMGAQGDLLQKSVLYGRIVILGSVPQMLHFVFESFIVTAEKPELGLKVTVAAGVTNIVLDALFVGFFHWEIAGAAAATVISQAIGGMIPLVYFARPNSSLLRLGKTVFDGKSLLRACVNGCSELMSNISMSLVGMLYNIQLMKYLGENGIAAYGILMYVNMIFIGAFIGYAVGTAPIVGFHYGAQNHSELHNILQKSLVILSSGGFLMFLAGEALAVPLSKIYASYDPFLLQITIHGFRIFSISFIPCGLAIYASSFFTALNDGITSAVISFLRTFVFEMAFVMLLPSFMGPDGIWYSIVAAEVMAVTISEIFILLNKKKYGY